MVKKLKRTDGALTYGFESLQMTLISTELSGWHGEYALIVFPMMVIEFFMFNRVPRLPRLAASYIQQQHSSGWHLRLNSS